MRRAALALTALALLAAPAASFAAPSDFGLEAAQADLSTAQAGAHPDLTFSFDIAKDPDSKPNVFGLRDGYATTRNVRFELPPGLVGDPSVLGVPQQCTVQELITWVTEEGCPNGSQVGRSTVYAYSLSQVFVEPVYMMAPPGGDVVARLGFVAGLFPTFIDLRVRSEDDYGLVAEIADSTAEARLIKAEATTWGVPADPAHDTERCTPKEVFEGCLSSSPRPPGSRALPFMTNPTHCGESLSMSVSASSWVQPQSFDTIEAPFPAIYGCDSLPFGPSLTAAPTNPRAASPTGLRVDLSLPGSDGADVLEASQLRDISIQLPAGLTANPAAAAGLGACDEDQVGLGTREASRCPDAAKLASAEFEVASLPRRLRGALYLRDPAPGDPFRIWIVADDQGAHVKLPGRLELDPASGEIRSVVLDAPQFPLREASIELKSGPRAPLVNPSSCGDYESSYELSPWSGGDPVRETAPMRVSEGCGTGGFDPQLEAGTTDPRAGAHSPFLFTLTRADGEQNPQGLDLVLPPGLSARLAGLARCEGEAARSGACPPDSRIGRVAAALGAGPTPLWVPEEGKRPTAVYLSGPYRGAPLSVIAVVPRQAGPFDFGDEVVRSAIYVDPASARATVKTDPLPQLIEGIPIAYRAIHVLLDRPDFALNPSGCSQRATEATVTSAQGAVAHPAAPFHATDCARLGFGPRLYLRLRGGTRRGAHPALRAVVRPRAGDSNIAGASVALPHSEFLDQAHIKTVCTRVQFAAQSCPPGSVYGHAVARSPLFDERLAGPVYLRSSSNPLPDLVAALRGPDSLPIEVELAGRIDSVNGGIRSTFSLVPDAPVSSFVLRMRGGKKGLLVNSRDICARPGRATARFRAQNGRRATSRPVLRASCAKRAAKRHRAHHRPR